MNKETRNQQPKLSTNSIVEISKKVDSELTEEQIGKVSAGLQHCATGAHIKGGIITVR